MEYMESKMQDQIEGAQVQHESLWHEVEVMRVLAREAYEAWGADNDARLGKLLRAMIDDEFRNSYRPDLRPNA